MKTPTLIGLIGYGKMGHAILTLLRRKGYAVTVLCRSAEKAREAERTFVRKSRRTPKTAAGSEDRNASEPIETHYRFTHDPLELKEASIVVETITESLSLKQELLRRVEGIVSEEALLVSNTSSISINAMASVLRRPERFCGLHFFYPLVLVHVVEIVTGEQTSREVVEDLKAWVSLLGKEPVVVRDGPGSVLNGILVHYYAEGAYLLEEGVGMPSQVDRAARRHFYVGPCESIDTIGIELFLEGLKNAPPPGSPSVVPIRLIPEDRPEATNEELGGRKGYYFPPLLTRLRQDGRFGKPAGRGLYLYANGRPVDDAPAYYFNAPRYGTRRCVAPEAVEDHMAHRLFFSVLNGTLWAMSQGFLTPNQADLGVREILQMPQGPVQWMRHAGRAAVASAFQDLVRTEGPRFDVSLPPEVFS
ncbi:3-hydroxyacyl-CoA dehydrogenase family protein [Desulfosoma sp.]